MWGVSQWHAWDAILFVRKLQLMFLNLNISFCSLSTNIWTIIKFKCIFYKPLRSLNRRFRRHFVFKGKKWHIFFLPFINEVILKCLPKMCPLTSRTPDAHVTFGKLRPPRVLIWRKMACWCPINMYRESGLRKLP